MYQHQHRMALGQTVPSSRARQRHYGGCAQRAVQTEWTQILGPDALSSYAYGKREIRDACLSLWRAFRQMIHFPAPGLVPGPVVATVVARAVQPQQGAWKRESRTRCHSFQRHECPMPGPGPSWTWTMD